MDVKTGDLSAVKDQERGQNKKRERRYLGEIPGPGYVWNPLQNYPRNAPCFCGSKIKFKRCHQGKIARCLKVDVAERAKQVLKAAIG